MSVKNKTSDLLTYCYFTDADCRCNVHFCGCKVDFDAKMPRVFGAAKVKQLQQNNARLQLQKPDLQQQQTCNLLRQKCPATTEKLWQRQLTILERRACLTLDLILV